MFIICYIWVIKTELEATAELLVLLVYCYIGQAQTIDDVMLLQDCEKVKCGSIMVS